MMEDGWSGGKSSNHAQNPTESMNIRLARASLRDRARHQAPTTAAVPPPTPFIPH
jgi:hypothetical protein